MERHPEFRVEDNAGLGQRTFAVVSAQHTQRLFLHYYSLVTVLFSM